MDPIDRDAIRSIVIKRPRMSGKTMMADTVAEVIENIINEFPSLDAVPVVRCKECKHRFDGENSLNCCEVLMKMSHWLVEIHVDDNWFCGNGEKEEK